MDEEKSYKNPLAGLDLNEVQVLLKEKLSTLPHGYKLPYMQWYEDDFKSSDGVEELSPLARLMYRQLLAKAWAAKEGPFLPADKERLVRLADCPDDESWKKHGPSVVAMFLKTKDRKRLFHPRQLLDYASQIIRISANTINGKKGGRPPKLKKTNKEPETQIETHSEPPDNPIKRQPELESESKPTSESELESTPKIPLDFLEDGQEETEEFFEDGESDMSKISKEIQLASGGRAKVYPQQDEQLKALEVEHSRSAVVTDFKAFLQENEGDDFRYGPVSAYLNVASDRLSAGTAPAVASARDPEVVSLARELTYASGGEIAFQDKQRSRLAEVLKEFSAAEITSAFSAWFADQDTSDPKNVSFLAGKFVQIADQLADTARRKQKESEQTRILRDQTAARLQEEAEQERLAKAQQEKLVEDFDPLS